MNHHAVGLFKQENSVNLEQDVVLAEVISSNTTNMSSSELVSLNNMTVSSDMLENLKYSNSTLTLFYKQS